MKGVSTYPMICWLSLVSLCMAGPVAWSAPTGFDQQLAQVLDIDPGEVRLKALRTLRQQAQQATRECPQCSNSWLELGIVSRELARTESGISGLKLARLSRQSLTRALRLDRDAGKGQALAYLGLLYHETPGWPFSFGDDEKAELLLKKALSLHPDNALSNLAYAEFCYDRQDFDKSRQYLHTAMQLPEFVDGASLVNRQALALASRLDYRTDKR